MRQAKVHVHFLLRLKKYLSWIANSKNLFPHMNYYFKLATINCCGMYFFRPDLMVKKLRYYARFIVVSLLLNKVDLVKELIQVLLIYATPCHSRVSESHRCLVCSESQSAKAKFLVSLSRNFIITSRNMLMCMKRTTMKNGGWWSVKWQPLWRYQKCFILFMATFGPDWIPF